MEQKKHWLRWTQTSRIELKDRLAYNPETGLFCWRIRQGGPQKHGWFPGTPTGTGYLSIRLDNKNTKCHRIAWYLHYGHWPEKSIDHINGIKSDNRISNLRLATQSENMYFYHKLKNAKNLGSMDTSK